jgi:hypothetical protein
MNTIEPYLWHLPSEDVKEWTLPEKKDSLSAIARFPKPKDLCSALALIVNGGLENLNIQMFAVCLPATARKRRLFEFRRHDLQHGYRCSMFKCAATVSDKSDALTLPGGPIAETTLAGESHARASNAYL